MELPLSFPALDQELKLEEFNIHLVLDHLSLHSDHRLSGLVDEVLWPDVARFRVGSQHPGNAFRVFPLGSQQLFLEGLQLLHVEVIPTFSRPGTLDGPLDAISGEQFCPFIKLGHVQPVALLEGVVAISP